MVRPPLTQDQRSRLDAGYLGYYEQRLQGKTDLHEQPFSPKLRNDPSPYQSRREFQIHRMFGLVG